MPSNITIEQMQDVGLHKLCERLCRDIMGTTRGDGTSLKWLLPIKLVYNPYPSYGSVKFKNPMTEDEYEHTYSDEETRSIAFYQTNAAIRDYNRQLKAYEEELDNTIGLEKRVEKLGKENLYPWSEFEPYKLMVQCVMPIYQDDWKKNDGRWQQTALGLRDFSNEIIYKKLNSCSTMDEAVNRFNRMIYDYLKAKVGNEQLDEKNTLYYPLKEFKDYFMRTDNSLPSLLHQEHQDMVKVSPFADVLYHNTAGKYWYNPDADERPMFSVTNYLITINADEQKLRVTNTASSSNVYKTRHKEKESGLMTATMSVPWKECGLQGTKGGGMNRHLQLLMRYAFFQSAVSNSPYQALSPIILADLFKKTVGRYYDSNTLMTYNSHLKNIFKDLLHLHSYDRESTIERYSQEQNGEDYIWYSCNIELAYRQVSTENKVDTLKKADVSDIDAWSDDKDVYSMNDVVSLEEAEYPLTHSGDKWKVRDEFIDSDLGELEE